MRKIFFEVNQALSFKLILTRIADFFRDIPYYFEVYILPVLLNFKDFLAGLPRRQLIALILAASIPLLAVISLIVSAVRGPEPSPVAAATVQDDCSDSDINITNDAVLTAYQTQSPEEAMTVSLSDFSSSNASDAVPNATLTLGVGEVFRLDGSVGTGATMSGTYSSDCPMIAAVDASSGVVTARSVGSAKITCSKPNGMQTICQINVKPLSAFLLLNTLTVELEEDELFDFNSLVPEGSATYFRNYYSENPSIAAISQAGGLLTAMNRGTTRIYCPNAGGVRAYATVKVKPRFRSLMTRFLRSQLGRHVGVYVKYINEKEEFFGITEEYSWCAIFAWCALDQFCEKLDIENPVPTCIHVSEIAAPARELGAVHLCTDDSYTPKPGDIFTTATVGVEGDDSYQHIGYIESVELVDNGKVAKVYTIEGNYDWESNYTTQTVVNRGVWVPGEVNKYGDQILEYIDLEQLLQPNLG